MRRILLLAALLFVILAAVGVLVLGAFPPDPHVQQIQKVLPNDRFQQPS